VFYLTSRHIPVDYALVQAGGYNIAAITASLKYEIYICIIYLKMLTNNFKFVFLEAYRRIRHFVCMSSISLEE